MHKLKNCPFCGDEVELVSTGLSYWKYAVHHRNNAKCVLDAKAFVLPYEKEDAIRMWNTRAEENK